MSYRKAFRITGSRTATPTLEMLSGAVLSIPSGSTLSIAGTVDFSGGFSIDELVLTDVGRISTSSTAGASLALDASTATHAEGMELRWHVSDWSDVVTWTDAKGMYLRMENREATSSGSVYGAEIYGATNNVNTKNIWGSLVYAYVKGVSAKTITGVYALQPEISFDAGSATNTITDACVVRAKVTGGVMSDYTALDGFRLTLGDMDGGSRTYGNGLLFEDDSDMSGTCSLTTGININIGCTTAISVAGAYTTGISMSGDGTTAINITSGFSGTTGLLFAGTATDGISITGACGDGVSISGTNTASALHISGDQVIGILYDVDASATHGIQMSVDTSMTLGTGIEISGAGTVTTGMVISATTCTTGISITAGSLTDGIKISATTPADGIDISSACSAYAIRISGTPASGIYVNGATNTGIIMGGAATTGLLISGATTEAIDITGNATTAINVDTGSFGTGMILGGTLTTGISIGACNTGIDFTGTLASSGIDFTGVTVTQAANRDNSYITIGHYGSSRVPIEIATLTYTFAPIQMHFDIAGTGGSGGSFRPIWCWTKIDTADQANTSVYGFMHYLEVQKTCTDLYGAFHQIVFNAASGTQSVRQVDTIHGAIEIGSGTTVNMDESASHGMCGVLGSLTGAGATTGSDRAYAVSGIVSPTCTYATAAMNAWVDGTAGAVHYDYIAPTATVTNGWLNLLDNTGATGTTTSSAVNNVGTKGWIRVMVNGATRYIALGDGVS